MLLFASDAPLLVSYPKTITRASSCVITFIQYTFLSFLQNVVRLAARSMHQSYAELEARQQRKKELDSLLSRVQIERALQVRRGRFMWRVFGIEHEVLCLTRYIYTQILLLVYQL